MKSIFWTYLATAVIALTTPVTTANASEAESSTDCGVISPVVNFDELSMDLKGCSANDGISFPDGSFVEIPSPGQALASSRLLAFGVEQEAIVWRNPDGTIGASYQGEVKGFSAQVPQTQNLLSGMLVDGGLNGITDAGCYSNSYSEHLWKHSEVYNWWYSPSGESSTRALARAKDAVDQWRFPKNRCNLDTFQTNFKASFMGVTDTSSSLSKANGCYGSKDAKNIISWGELPTGTLGRTCTEYNVASGMIIETDIRLNLSMAQNQFFDLADSTLCGVGDYLLVTTLAHEVGHAIGLGHAAETASQLMSPFSPQCTVDFIGLAPGDYLGLKQHYGVRGLYEAI